jgi:hypothetical protein
MPDECGVPGIIGTLASAGNGACCGRDAGFSRQANLLRPERRIYPAEQETWAMGSVERSLLERTGPPHNPGLKELIEAKHEWHHRPDAEAEQRGFPGWHERGYLPHFDVPNVTQFVTFSLRNAFPVTRRREWEPLLHEGDESLRKR